VERISRKSTICGQSKAYRKLILRTVASRSMLKAIPVVHMNMNACSVEEAGRNANFDLLVGHPSSYRVTDIQSTPATAFKSVVVSSQLA
jgi:hypothetical protein